MPKYAIAPDAEQAKVNATVSEGADLTEYQNAVSLLARPENKIDGGKYSKWLRVDLLKDETRKSESRRFSTAAKVLGLHVQSTYEKPEDRMFWIRTRPAPKARAKKNGAVS